MINKSYNDKYLSQLYMHLIYFGIYNKINLKKESKLINMKDSNQRKSITNKKKSITNKKTYKQKVKFNIS